MPKHKKSTFISTAEDSVRSNINKQLKKELMDVFRRFGYLSESKDYEVTFRTTSGNIAWISINSIETIK
jgi:hypothetical protein